MYGEYPIIDRVLYIPGGASFLPSRVFSQDALKYDCSISLEFLLINIKNIVASLVQLMHGYHTLLDSVFLPAKERIGCLKIR